MKDNLISRQAAIGAIEQLVIPEDMCVFEILSHIELAIGTLPSAQPERKMGRWEYIDYGGFGNYHCTACGEICICNGDYDFCPNCGAKMENDL